MTEEDLKFEAQVWSGCHWEHAGKFKSAGVAWAAIDQLRIKDEHGFYRVIDREGNEHRRRRRDRY